jgi:hypothetical protein
MQRTLTDAFIARLRAPSTGRTEITDARCVGLVLRCTSAGAKSFSFKYRAKGGRGVQRVTLGSYPALGFGKARQRVDAMRAAIVAGDDPATDRREERAGGRTFDRLAERYVREHAERHKREISARMDTRNLRLHVLPKWGRRDYTTIRRADVIELVEGVIAAGKPTLANRVQSLVSKIFSFALDAGLMESHPCSRMAYRSRL